MWDDWICLAWLTQSHPDWMFQHFNNYGVSLYSLVYLPFFAISNDASISVIIAKAAYFLGVIINALLIMLISKKVSHGNLGFATLAGIFAVCFPALSGEGFHLSALIYYFFIPLFLVGLLLFIKVASSKKVDLLLRIAALSALFVSFSLNSILVMFYALVPAIFYASLHEEKKRLQDIIISIRLFLTRHMDFLLLPFIFWGIKKIFMPCVGIYARYNQMSFDFLGILSSYKKLIPDILQTTLYNPLSIQYVFWTALVTFVLVMFSGQSLSPYFKKDINLPKNHLMILFCFGLLALVGTAFPYYIVGRRSFQAFGFMSRDNVLFPLPVSWISAALFCMLLKPQSSSKSSSLKSLSFLRQRISFAVLVSLIISQSLANWRNHADWQAHYVYYRSVIEKLTQDELVREASVIQLVDQLPGDRSLQAWKYPTSIWTEIISAAFHKTARLAIPFPPENGQFFTNEEINRRVRETEVDFMLRDINLKGPQIKLTIQSTNVSPSPLRLALAYWQTRFFYPADMPKLLDSLTQIKSERLIGRH